MMNLFRTVIVGLVFAHAAYAAPPEIVRFHGAIGELGGQPVQDGNYLFLAEIFAEAVGGTAVYTQSVTASVSAGAYTVVLSPTTPGDLNAAFADSPRFLQITVVSGPGGTLNQTLLPRQEIASVPFALYTDHADTAEQATTNATTDSPGVVRLATDAEAAAGTEANSSVTPDNLGHNYDSTPQHGYFEVVGSGLLVQFMRVKVTSTGGQNFDLPTAFADANYVVIGSRENNSARPTYFYAVDDDTISINAADVTPPPNVNVVAIGKTPPN